MILTRPCLLILPSVGVETPWRDVDDDLVARGWTVGTITVADTAHGAEAMLRELAQQIPAGPPVLLIAQAHSGRLVPALTLGRHVVGTIYVDVALPFSSETAHRVQVTPDPDGSNGTDRSITLPPGWHRRPAAYLALDGPHELDRTRAVHWGWPTDAVTVERPDHRVIASAVDGLATRLLEAPAPLRSPGTEGHVGR